MISDGIDALSKQSVGGCRAFRRTLPLQSGISESAAYVYSTADGRLIGVIPVKSAHRTFAPSSGVRVFTLPTAVKSASARICGTKDRHRATGRSIRLERPMSRPAPNPLVAIEHDVLQ